MSRSTDDLLEERQVDRGRSQRRHRDVTETEILESMPDGVVTFDAEWRITYVNSAAEHLYGMPRQSLVGRNHWGAFPATIGTLVEREYRRAMSDRVAMRFENLNEAYGRWLEIDACPMQNGGLAVYGRDVTRRKRAEARLRRSEAYLAEGQRLSHTGSGAWNVSTGEAFWSDETYRIYGFAPGTVRPSAELFFGIVHAEDRLWLEQAFESVVRQRKGYDLEFRIVRPDETTRFIHSVGTAVTNEAGDVSEVVGTVLDVTEREQADEALRKSSSRIEDILESVTDTFWALDRDWRFTYINRRALARVRKAKGQELTREEVVGQNVWKLLPVLVGSAIYDKCHEALREQRTVHFEAYSEPSGGWVEVHVYPSKEGLSVYSQDITERKRVEEQLSYHAHLLENIHDAIIATDEQFVLTAWNKAAEQMYGWTADEVVGRKVWEVVPTDLTDDQRAEAGRQLAETGRRHTEVMTYRKDGTPIPVEGRSITLRGEQGQVSGYLSINRDITERKRSEEALRVSNRRVESTLESITDEFFALDREWRFTYINERALGRLQKLKGEELTREEVLGKNVWEMFPDHVGSVFYEKYHEAMREQKTMEFEGRSVAADGWAEQHVYPSEGGLSVYSRDITQRKRAERALHQAQAELAHAARLAAIGELTASLAHELSQPLAAIATQAGACLGWLGAENPDLEEAQAAVQQIIRDAERGGQAIEQTRRLARKSTAEKTVFDINDAIGEVLVFIEVAIRDHRIAVRKSLAAELPLVSGIRVQIQQVVLNLALNAIDAMEHVSDGRRELVIRSEHVKDGEDDSVLVALQDSGIGFREQDLARLFDAFYTTKSDGLGLGLSISQSIIADHGGRLWATRNDEGGATFQFVVPTGVPRI